MIFITVLDCFHKKRLQQISPHFLLQIQKVYKTPKATQDERGFRYLKKAATYSSTNWGSTISTTGLNFSVRNGKR